MKLSFEQKQELGLQYLTDLMHPATPFGGERIRAQHIYAPEERGALEDELDNVAYFYRALEEERDAVAALEHAMSQLKDVRGSLRRCLQGGRLGEVELFQVSAFLSQLQRTVSLARSLKGYSGLHGAALSDVDGALAVLDPTHSGRLTFYIEDARTPELLSIRTEKAQVEREAAACPAESKVEVMARRLDIVKREELELSRIYASMSDALRPFVPALLDNTQSLGVMDAAMQKARLARRFPSVRPQVGAEVLSLENAVNPMVAEALADQKRQFTPISIQMPKGVTVLTGANMGGKSVAIAAVALNVCLALMGCFVFCSSAQVPMFRHIELINRDFSSSQGGLSSFGGEIQRFNQAADRIEADAPSLLLMDEFARGTNCDEGAAIVRAAARWLNGRNAFTLLATHYDGAAEYAAAHYQVRGLSRMPETPPGPGADRLRAIADSMDYGLIRVDPRRPCPRDGVKICRLLGMREEILNFIQNPLDNPQL